MLSKTTVLSSVLLALSVNHCLAQDNDASYEEIAAVDLSFRNAGLNPSPIPSEWMDIQAVLKVSFGDVDVANIGDTLTVAQVQTAPTYTLSETEEADEKDTFDSDRLFTVAFLDAGVYGRDNSNQVTRHFLQNNFTVDDDVLRPSSNVAPITSYGAPFPTNGDGPHRYMQLVFQQYQNFTPPSSPSTGSPIQTMSITDYYRASNGGLGKVVAANYILIEQGQATASVSSIQPVNTQSIDSLASSLSVQATATGLSTTRTSSTSSPTSTRNSSGAMASLSFPSSTLSALVTVAGAALLGGMLL
ncbi:PEBP-like protein [Violaceomyces palustris]|uniref:PEBP-like protein n=1 Tax=Violaceomyces palustris TaxID=1673888 RepID=A0ACD0NRA1_9BASI|nr:PEBP-like protein [Violaceomyces palustris]